MMNVSEDTGFIFKHSFIYDAAKGNGVNAVPCGKTKRVKISRYRILSFIYKLFRIKTTQYKYKFNVTYSPIYK